MRRMPLLLVAIAASRRRAPCRPTADARPPRPPPRDRGRCGAKLDGTLVLSSTNDGALRELERRIFNERKEFNGLFKAAGKPEWF